MKSLRNTSKMVEYDAKMPGFKNSFHKKAIELRKSLTTDDAALKSMWPSANE
jgi:hypothetical protein